MMNSNLAQHLISKGWINLASLNEEMKLIDVCEASPYGFPFKVFEAWKDGRNKQLSADRLTHDKKREELEAEIQELIKVLKSIRAWLMFPTEITQDGGWNEQFVKANNLTNEVLAKYLQEKGQTK
jgi:hypothetical protein